MELLIITIIFALIWGATTTGFILTLKKSGNFTQNNDLQKLSDIQKSQYEALNSAIIQAMNSTNLTTQNAINNLNLVQKQEFEIVSKRVDELTTKNESKIEKLTFDVNQTLANIRQENEKAIEKMRETVDEKLNSSLSQRLNDSFSKIQQSLESVNLGIGEMRSLANGVSDIKKVLSNVKVRGCYSEVMLSTMLSQMLTKNQYREQVQVKQNSKERVDFAIVMPGKDGNEVLLPIDSKFPLEDYNRYIKACETINKDEIDKSLKALLKRIKDEAKSIHEKYINVPKTTDFAVMFLPIEGLYAEVARDIELMDTLQNDLKVIVCGPTTLSALLNSLQLGFKTLYIEKRSSELWQILSTFKQEFEKFVNLLLKTQNKLGEANSTIELATKSSRKIAKKLDDVSQVVGIEYDKTEAIEDEKSTISDNDDEGENSDNEDTEA